MGLCSEGVEELLAELWAPDGGLCAGHPGAEAVAHAPLGGVVLGVQAPAAAAAKAHARGAPQAHYGPNGNEDDGQLHGDCRRGACVCVLCVCVGGGGGGRGGGGEAGGLRARTVALPVKEVVGLALQAGRDIVRAQDGVGAALVVEHGAKGARPAVLGAIAGAPALGRRALLHGHREARGGVGHPVGVRARRGAKDGVPLPSRAQAAVRDPKGLQRTRGVDARARGGGRQGRQQQQQRLAAHFCRGRPGRSASGRSGVSSKTPVGCAELFDPFFGFPSSPSP